MTTVTVVEPNGLLRLGILKILENLPEGISTEGVDHAQLAAKGGRWRPPDLALLSVPADYQETVNLISAVQEHLTPGRFLLLSDHPTLPYSLLKLPHRIAGYLSKYSDGDMLLKAITLVLAGGTCFPHPDSDQDAPSGAIRLRSGPACVHCPLSRKPLAAEPAHSQEPVRSMGLLVPVDAIASPAISRTDIRITRQPAAPPLEPIPRRSLGPLPQKSIDFESHLLNLTHRQYEVLVLLARGLPLKSISRELKISASTAKAHTEALYMRLAVNNRNAAVYTAIARGATLGWDHLPDKSQAMGPMASASHPPQPPHIQEGTQA